MAGFFRKIKIIRLIAGIPGVGSECKWEMTAVGLRKFLTAIMPVTLGGQHPTIGMSKPASDCPEIKSELDCVGPEKMPAAVMKMREVRLLASCVHGNLGLLDWYHHQFIRPTNFQLFHPAVAQVQQKFLKGRKHQNRPRVIVFSRQPPHP